MTVGSTEQIGKKSGEGSRVYVMRYKPPAGISSLGEARGRRWRRRPSRFAATLVLLRHLQADATQRQGAVVLENALPRPLRLAVEQAVAEGVHKFLLLVVCGVRGRCGEVRVEAEGAGEVG